MRKKILQGIFSLCIATAIAQPAKAQLGHSKEYVEPPGWSLGMTFGLSDLWGDVGTKTVIDHYANKNYWKKPHFMGGLFGRYTAHPGFAIRMGVNYGVLYANDNWNINGAEASATIESDAYQRYFRNLHVRTTVWEGSLMMEFNIFRFNYNTALARKSFQPYLLAGVAAFHFRPQAEYIDRNHVNHGYIDLHKLHIEGEGLPGTAMADPPAAYSLMQMAVPLGIGVKWDIGRRMALGIEYVYRLTFTDYLDNVSGRYIDPDLYHHSSLKLNNEQITLAKEMQDRSWLIDENAPAKTGQLRGNSANKDGYSTFGISLIFKIPSKKSPWW